MEKQTEEERRKQYELIKITLLAYKERITRYKDHKIQKYGLHKSLFVDLDNRKAKVENLLDTELNNRLDRILLQRNLLQNSERQDCKLLITVLDLYQKNLLKVREEIQERFPDVELKDTEETNKIIEQTKKKIEERATER